jgi:D-hexose-6-phosphate mutarotase
MDMDMLNKKLGSCRGVAFKTRDGMPVALVENASCSAELSLYGGHLMGWTPKGARPVLWLSKAAKIVEGQSMRGGVPLCWPWFGAHPSDKSAPLHGSARLALWDFVSASDLADATEIVLSLDENAILPQFKTQRFKLFYKVVAGRELKLSLEIVNSGSSELSFSAAFHTYFNVADIGKTLVKGLEKSSYRDNTVGEEKGPEGKPVVFPGWVGRTFHNVSSAEIDDPVLKRRIGVSGEGASSIVVWNPGEGVQDKFPGFAPGDEKTFVCVENAQPELVRVAPGARHVWSLIKVL